MADNFTVDMVFRVGEPRRVTWCCHIVTEMGEVPEAPLTGDEMQQVAFATKMAVARVLNARAAHNRPVTDITEGEKAQLPPDTEHPEHTSHDLRQRWLYQSQQHLPPEDFAEFITKSMGILSTWYDRWSGLWKKVNPKAFRTEEEKNTFLRENDLKALGLWHAMRDLRAYWKEAGVWDGNPYDPDDAGEVAPNKKVQ